jgi:hypothetical protein
MSHTTKVKVEFLNMKALEAAVLAMGGKWLGLDQDVSLFSTREHGAAFKLAEWKYPCVLTNDGLKLDTYGGVWGDIRDIDTLKAEYALQVAEQTASLQGWYSERVNDEVLIHHPDGGVIRVTAEGAIDASQFTGASCVSATALIEGALGLESQTTLKAEFYNQSAVVKVKGE